MLCGTRRSIDGKTSDMAFITLIYHLHALMFVYVFYHFVLEQKQQKSCFQEGRLCPGPTLLLLSAYLLVAKHPCDVVIVAKPTN